MIYGLLGVLGQTLLSIGGLYKIKTAESVMCFDFFIGIGFYGLSFVVWIYLLRVYPVSIIFPLAISLNLIVTELVGWFYFNENRDVWQAIALFCIITGVILLSISGKKFI